ncbi:hypothetical protein [Pantoea agglomerans]
MAAVDPIVYAQLCKLFPFLTPRQATNCCFYSLGINHQDISTLVGTSPIAVKKSIESSQKYFQTDSLPELKTVFWTRFTYRQICMKYHIGDNQSGIVSSDAFKPIHHIFPELNRKQIFCVIHNCAGFAISDISQHSNVSVSDLEIYLREGMKLLEATTHSLLQVLVTSRFVLDLC